MRICEIFTSIQGESTYAGTPCTFVRLTGCNLRCIYCDTAYAYEEGAEMSEDEIVLRVEALGVKTVEITGGEPLLQKGVLGLITRLLDLGYEVLIETNGTRDIAAVDRRAVIILDIKTPGSGVSEEAVRLSNLGRLKSSDEVKFVITGRGDYEWAKRFVEEHELIGRNSVLFSPAGDTVEPRTLADWIIADKLPVRLNLQIHKYLYGPGVRGV